MEKIDAAVIGAGVVGLAVGRMLSASGLDVCVVEAEEYAGTGVSSRNSGVIHAGIYYPTGSNKARLCVRGKTLLYDYVRKKDISFLNCGKLIVATQENELPVLEAIKTKALANGVEDLEFYPAEKALELEPQLSCVGALFSPSTGIIDVHDYLNSLMFDIENDGGIIAFRNKVISIHPESGGFRIVLESGEIWAGSLVNAGGLAAQGIAKKIEGFPAAAIPTQYLAKGSYFSVSGPRPFTRLVYPIPVPGGLGAHFTRNMAGESLFGPDVEWLNIEDPSQINYNVDQSRGDRFKESVRRYWHGVDDRALQPAYSGVRPKIAGPSMPDGDFIIQTEVDHGLRGLINLYGIESPGLTSSLAIAEEVETRLRHFTRR